MTIKQLANEMGVSKPTIRNAISELGLQGKLCKIGNRYMLSDDQIMKIKLQISEKSKNEVLPKSEKTEKSESEALPKSEKTEKSESEVLPKSEKTEKSESEVLPKSEKSESEILPKSEKTESEVSQKSKKMENDIWREQLAVKDGQIKLLQEQLIVKDRQIDLLQEQISQLTSAMESMATALTASQVLHAGTIQKQFTEHSESIESSFEQEQPKQKLGFLSRLLGRKE